MAVNFNASASSAQFDMNADSGDAQRQQHSMLKWDRKRKKMVHFDPVSRIFSLLRSLRPGLHQSGDVYNQVYNHLRAVRLVNFTDPRFGGVRALERVYMHTKRSVVSHEFN